MASIYGATHSACWRLASYGWIQVINFIVAGVLSLIFAVGVARRLPDGPGSTWAPRLLALFGAGLVIGGVFKADPALGFPAGAPAGYPEQLSVHGTIHAFAPPLAFLSVVAACFVIARRFAAEGMRRAAVLTRSGGSGVLRAQRACRTRCQRAPLRCGGAGIRLGDRIRRIPAAPLNQLERQGLIATTMSRRIEESTRCSKSR